MKDVWVSGADGLLGMALRKQGYRGFSKKELDITDRERLFSALKQGKPRVFINAAAQARVDLAEQEKERTFAVNAYAVAVLAEICASLSIRLIHISTDYVLDDPDRDVLSEQLTPNPRSTYAVSKWQGEEAALAYDAVVLRVQWLYGCGQKSFFATALRRLYRRQPLVLVRDQIGSPTPVDWVSEGIGAALTGNTGLYHLACSGAVSAEDWIVAAAKRLNIAPEYETMTRAELSAVYRPSRSCLGSDLFSQTFAYPPLSWSAAMERCLEQAGTRWLDQN